MKPTLSAFSSLIIIIGLFLGSNSIANAQQGDIIPNACATATYTLDPGTSIHFYDDGGPGGNCTSGGSVANGNYANGNCETITTICPAACESLDVEFLVLSMYGTSSGWDWMVIYEGVGTTGTILFDNRAGGPDNPRGTDCNFMNNNDVLNLITAQDQCLTFRFYATSVVNKEGWDAIVISSPVAGSGAVNVDVTSPTCSADGFAQISNYDNTATYTFTPAGPTIGSNGEITGAVFGQQYTVEEGGGGCATSFQIDEQLVTPDAPGFDITDPTCLADGSAEINNYDAGATYTFTPAGPSVGGSGAITGVVFGQNYSVEIDNGDCTATASFQVEEQITSTDTPNIDVTNATCSADGFAEILNYDNTLTYIFTPAGPTIGSAGEIIGAVFGQNYSIEISGAACPNNFQIQEQLVTPDAPNIDVTDPTCLADGFAEIIDYDAGATYTFTPAGPSIGAAGVITGAVFGQNYSVEIDNGDCAATASLQIEEQLDTPSPDFFGDSMIGCSPHTVTFIDTSGFPNATCTWDFGDGNTSNICDTVSHTYTVAGIYDVTLTIVSADGCVGDTTLTSYIEVLESPIANFTADPMITDFNNTEINFTNTSVNATNYIWDFGDLSYQSNDVDPVHEFPDGVTNEYIVTLYAIGDLGCLDSTYLTIIINNPDIEISIPNIFTPNGDNENDFFQLINVQNISELEVIILNRWGNLVFESSELNFKWNGSVQNNGPECSDGTYFYKITAKDLNGEEVLKHGFVQLSRGK
ncbi:MAG TPA: gliding motility-associated C-terminal domain-containing protein [Brumimicrobium sp.]|nr:gliding motility-associated C-terminal domain-containing protein [Brumimicrobium sp.]